MKSYVKSEFKRALFSKNSLIVFTITLALLVFAYNIFTSFEGFSVEEFREIYDSAYVFIIIRNDLIAVVIPILAAIVFSDSYLLDKQSGSLKLIFTRMKKSNYIFTKLFVNSVVSGLVVSVAMIIVFVFLYFIWGINDTIPNPIVGPFSFIFYKSKVLYVAVLILITFMFNVIFSTIALGVSAWINNRYLAVLSPFFYYIISGTLLAGFGKLQASNLFVLNPIVNENEFITYQIILFSIGILLFYIGVMSKNEKNN